MSERRWSPADLPSLAGTTAVVTGGNSGIGWYTALELARHGAQVTLAVRNDEKGQAAAARIRDAADAADVRVARLDLGSLAGAGTFRMGVNLSAGLGDFLNVAGAATGNRARRRLIRRLPVIE